MSTKPKPKPSYEELETRVKTLEGNIQNAISAVKAARNDSLYQCQGQSLRDNLNKALVYLDGKGGQSNG